MAFNFPTPEDLQGQTKVNLEGRTEEVMKVLAEKLERAASEATDTSMVLTVNLPVDTLNVLPFVAQEVSKRGWSIRYEQINGDPADQREHDYVRVVASPSPHVSQR